jgi:hypothetical protein
MAKLNYCLVLNLYETPHTHTDVLPSPNLGPRWALVFKTTELWGLEGTFLTLSTKRGRGVC